MCGHGIAPVLAAGFQLSGAPRRLVVKSPPEGDFFFSLVQPYRIICSSSSTPRGLLWRALYGGVARDGSGHRTYTPCLGGLFHSNPTPPPGAIPLGKSLCKTHSAVSGTINNRYTPGSVGRASVIPTCRTQEKYPALFPLLAVRICSLPTPIRVTAG